MRTAWHKCGASTIAFQRDTVATRGIRYLSSISSRTSHICFLVALLRLQDGFSVTFHLCCCLELVLGVDPAVIGGVSILLADPAVIGVVSILLADGARIESIMNHSHNTSVSVMSR